MSEYETRGGDIGHDFTWPDTTMPIAEPPEVAIPSEADGEDEPSDAVDVSSIEPDENWGAEIAHPEPKEAPDSPGTMTDRPQLSERARQLVLAAARDLRNRGQIAERAASSGGGSSAGAELIETFDTETHEVVVNRGYYDHDALDTVVNEAQNGVPDTWTERQVVNPHPGRHYYVDDDAEPEFFAKVSPAQTPEEEAADPRSGWDEIRLAPQVKAALDEAQHIATDNGFASIGLIEPLMATTNVETGEETVVYPWRDGHIVDFGGDREGMEPLPGGSEAAAVEAVYTALYNFFEERGITARDLSPEHLMVYKDTDGAKHLQLFDIEGWYTEDTSLDDGGLDYSPAGVP